MNYQISEDEHRLLELLRDQIGLFAALFGGLMKSEMAAIEADGIYAFLNAQHQTLIDVMHAADQRHKSQWEQEREQGTMSATDWTYALRIARGDGRHAPNEAVDRINRKLASAALIDSDMRAVQDEWFAAIAQQEPASATTSDPKKTATSRKRDQLTAGAA